MKDLTRLSLKQLAARYNDAARQLKRPEIKKFSNRESGVRRTNDIETDLHAAKKKAPDKESSGRGRPAAFAGKKLHPIVVTNPRQAGSHGWHSLKIVLDNPGITYEDYKVAGGRNNDLRWDVAHCYVEVK